MNPNETQPAADNDHAVGSAAGPNGSPPAIPIAALSLTPSKTDADRPVQHRLQKATDSPITGLADGTTYYVVNRTANSFQLAATMGGPALTISGSGHTGTHTIGVEGIDFTSAGSGRHQLTLHLIPAAPGLLDAPGSALA